MGLCSLLEYAAARRERPSHARADRGSRRVPRRSAIAAERKVTSSPLRKCADSPVHCTKSVRAERRTPVPSATTSKGQVSSRGAKATWRSRGAHYPDVPRLRRHPVPRNDQWLFVGRSGSVRKHEQAVCRPLRQAQDRLRDDGRAVTPFNEQLFVTHQNNYLAMRPRT